MHTAIFHPKGQIGCSWEVQDDAVREAVASKEDRNSTDEWSVTQTKMGKDFHSLTTSIMQICVPSKGQKSQVLYASSLQPWRIAAGIHDRDASTICEGGENAQWT